MALSVLEKNPTEQEAHIRQMLGEQELLQKHVQQASDVVIRFLETSQQPIPADSYDEMRDIYGEDFTKYNGETSLAFVLIWEAHYENLTPSPSAASPGSSGGAAQKG